MSSSIRRMLKMVTSVAVETIYPRTCAGCGMRGTWLCEFCEPTVPPATLPISCLRCGVPMITNRCGCGGLDTLITQARSAFVYDGWAATAVKLVKYHGEPARAEHLAAVMLPLLHELGAVDGLIPVPLHASREKQRGFNQARLLAGYLAGATGVPVVDVLRRTRKTVSQTELSGSERANNVLGAFSLDESWIPLPRRRYLLIDDVRTTSATLNACAAALRTVRPAELAVLTFALDMHGDQIRYLREYEARLRTRGSVSPAAHSGSSIVPSHPLRGRRRGS